MAQKPKPEPTEFGKRLRAARLRAGFTQQQLAAVVGCDAGRINRLETLPTANPTLKSVQDIAAALGVSPGKLVDG